MSYDNGYRLHIHRIDNETFVASVLGPDNNTSILEVLHGKRDYDDQGALTYVVAVIFLYGFSVIFIIASLVKKTAGDHGVSTYMSDLDKIRQLEQKQRKKIKVKKILKKVYNKHRNKDQTNNTSESDTNTQKTPLMAPPLWAAMESSSRQSSNWSLSSYREEDEVNYLLPPSQYGGGSSPPSPKSPRSPSKEVRLSWLCDDVPVVNIPVITAVDASSSPETVELPLIVETPDNLYKLNLTAAQIALDTLHEVEEEHV